MPARPPLADVATSVPATLDTEGRGIRPEIQALRALAVVLVLVYHYWPGIVRGGFVGVDVFFVISGYLITAHLVRARTAGFGRSLFEFWARRARRLLPAALSVLVLTALGVLLVVPRSLWQQFFEEIGASALYVQNWLLAFNSVDYLAANNVPSPVQHYWSLSVEEQFYLVWPLLVLGVSAIAIRRSRSGRVPLLVLLGIVTAASLAYSAYLTSQSPSVAYFATTTRAWEFAAGGVLAVLLPNGVSGIPRARAVLSWAGLAAIAASALLYTGATPFPGIAAIVPVAGTLAVLSAAMSPASLAPSRIYAFRPVQYLGDISYSLYLWHFPLLILAGYAFAASTGVVFKAGVLICAIVLAALSKRFLEDPVRRAPLLTKHRPRRTLLFVPVAMLVVVAVAASGWYAVQASANAVPAQAKALQQDAPSCFGAAALAPPKHRCPAVPLSKVVPQPALADAGSMVAQNSGCLQAGSDSTVHPCVFGVKSSKIRVALIGDSHAAAWFTAVNTLAIQEGWQLTTYLHAGCPFGIGNRVYAQSHPGYIAGCQGWNLNLAALLRSVKPFNLVITTGFEDDSHFVDASGQHSNPATVAAYQKAWKPILAAGTNLAVLHDTPHMSTADQRCIVAHLSAPLQCSADRAASYDRDNNLTAAASQTAGATAIDMYDYFCTAKTCPVIVGGVFVYRDRDHITTTFSQSLAPWLRRALAAAHLLPKGR